MSESQLTTNIDFGCDGRQLGHVRIPHSVHRSAYGWLPMPIACFKNGDGPTTLLMSGTHGDEYEGQVCLSKLINDLNVNDLKGRIIVLPMANFPAARDGLRTSSIDALNLNRIYPGNPNGSVTEMIADYIENELLELADYALDLHSGGSSLNYLPMTVGWNQDDEESQKRMLDLLQAFSAPRAFVFPSGHGRGLSFGAAIRKNTIMIGTEVGGAGTVDRNSLKICEQGVHNALVHIGHLEGDLKVMPAEALMHAPGMEYYSYASENGLFEPCVDLGDEVREGDLAGRIHFPDSPGKAHVEVNFMASGTVLCQRIPGQVLRGDCVFHLGIPLP